jgi:hypothetical protein
MIKLKSLLPEVIVRRSFGKLAEASYSGLYRFVIDNGGEVWNYNDKQHGMIVYEYPALLRKAIERFPGDGQIETAAEGPDDDLMNILLNAGFIRGGVFDDMGVKKVWVEFSNRARKDSVFRVVEIAKSKNLPIYVDFRGYNGAKITHGDYTIDEFESKFL